MRKGYITPDSHHRQASTKASHGKNETETDTIQHDMLNKPEMKMTLYHKNELAHPDHHYFPWIVIVLTIALTLLMITSMFHLKNKTSETIENNISSWNTQNEYMVEHKQNLMTKVVYPKIAAKNISGKIREDLQAIVSQYYHDNATTQGNQLLRIQYHQNMITDDIQSIQFRIQTPQGESVKNYTISVTKDEILSLENFIPADRLKTLQETMKHKMSTHEELRKYTDEVDLSQFLITSKGMIFYFNHGYIDKKTHRIPSIALDAKELSAYISADYASLWKSIFPSVIPQEIEAPIATHPPSTKKMLALTFDDGPHGTYTSQILQALTKFGGHATFFMLGNRAVNYTDVIKEIVAQGSELGNHSWSHPQLTKLSVAQINKEINDTQNVIEKAAGKAPKLVRPPYGAINPTVKATIPMPLILWNIDTEDWKSKNVDAILKIATSQARDGSIILMHDIYKTSEEAAVKLIEHFSHEGYQLVTISELFQAKGKSLVSGKAYTNP